MLEVLCEPGGWKARDESHQMAGESDPHCRAEQSLPWYSPRAVPFPAAQGQKGFPWLGRQHIAWFDTAHGSRLLLPLFQGWQHAPRQWSALGGLQQCAGAAALRCAGALHSPMCSSARVLCAWHTMAGWLLLEQNGSPGLKDHLVLLYYFHHALNPLILAWSLGKVTWSSVSHFRWELLQPL